MSDKVAQERLPQRISVIAEAARIPLTEEACARVARAVAPTISRFTAAGVAVEFEVEPASIAAIARAEVGR
jgi:hypothetical protein